MPVLVCDGSLPIEIGRVAGFGGYDGAFGFDRIVDDVRAGLHGWDGACLEILVLMYPLNLLLVLAKLAKGSKDAEAGLSNMRRRFRR